jgi:hypothetical protein
VPVEDNVMAAGKSLRCQPLEYCVRHHPGPLPVARSCRERMGLR